MTYHSDPLVDRAFRAYFSRGRREGAVTDQPSRHGSSRQGKSVILVNSSRVLAKYDVVGPKEALRSRWVDLDDRQR